MNSLLSTFRAGEPRRQEHTRLWWVVLGLGVVVIIFANLLPIDDRNLMVQWLTTLVLCILMGIYGHLANRNVHVSPDTKGDGIYYLGLLFTFAALVAALIKFGKFEPEVANSLIVNFGIALVTTIFGLAGRVGFSMGQESAGDITADAVNALEDAVDFMKLQAIRSGEACESLVGHLESSERVWRQTVTKISGTAEEIGDSWDDFTQVTKGLAGGVEEFKKATKEIVSSSQRVAADIASSASQVSGPMHDASKRIARLNEECQKFNDVLGQARRALEAIDGNRFARGITGFEDTVQSVSEHISALRRPLEEAGKTISVFGDKADSGMQSLENLDDAGRRIVDVGANLTDFSDALDRLQAALRQVSRDGAGASEGLVDASQAVQNMYATAQNAAEPLRQAATDASQLTETVSHLQGKTDGLRNDLEGAGKMSKVILLNLEAAHTEKPWKRMIGWFQRRPKPK